MQIAQIRENPHGVKVIGEKAFAECTYLATIDIPDSVTNIGLEAFWGTAWLKIQPPMVIVNTVFYRYKGRAKHVTIPDGITAICGGAFARCYHLVSVDIPDSVTSIGKYAFAAWITLRLFIFQTALQRLKTGLLTVVLPLFPLRYPTVSHRSERGHLPVAVVSLLAYIDIPDNVTFKGGERHDGLSAH